MVSALSKDNYDVHPLLGHNRGAEHESCDIPASLPTTPPRALTDLAAGATPSALRLMVWVLAFSTILVGALGAASGSSMSLPEGAMD